MQAQDIMTIDLVTVQPDTPVEDIAETLLKSKVSAVPVVDASGAVVGMVSEGDLVRRIENETLYADSWWLAMFTTAKDRVGDFKKFHGRTAADVMTKDVITITGDVSVVEIARILDWYNIKRVPVTSNDTIVGIVSRADLILNLANSHRDAQTEVVDRQKAAARRQAVKDVIASSRVKPWMVNASVNGEHVELFGLVDSLQDSETLAKEILALPGVTSVDTDMLRQSSEQDRAVRG